MPPFSLAGSSLITFSFRESAATLQAESGYSLEAPEVTEFRQHILHGAWTDAEPLLVQLGVTDEDALLVHAHPSMMGLDLKSLMVIFLGCTVPDWEAEIS